MKATHGFNAIGAIGFNTQIGYGFSGSPILAYILYSDPFTYTLDANGNTLMTNKGTASDATVTSGHGIELQVDNLLPLAVSPNTYITLVNGDGAVTQIDNTADASTTYTLTNQTVLEATPTTAPFTAGDLALIEADTSLMTRLSKGATDTGLSLVTADVFGHYAFMEKGGAFCVDDRAVQPLITTSYTPYTEGVGNTNTHDGTKFIIHNEAVTANGARPYCQTYNSVAVGIRKIVINIKILSGQALYSRLFSPLIVEDLTLTVGEYEFIYLSNTDAESSAIFDGTLIDNAVFDAEVIVASYDTTASEISNYLDTVRKNRNFEPKGPQGIEFERDGVGVPTVFNNAQMNMHSDTSANLQWNPSTYSEFIIEESVGLVFYSHIYDGVNLTTWTNGVEGTVTAHTPENANYLLGKGLYPKVTADPYTTYVQDYFEVILDATEIAAYDALQAYNDYIA